jgi:hypothetical protein
MDILDTIFRLQKELAVITTSPKRYPQTKEERISALATAIH